jgi:predicted SprT family Zn-dependent metalloprotease
MTTPTTVDEMRRMIENKMLDVLAKLESHYKKGMPIPAIHIKPRIGRKLGFANKSSNSVTFNQDACVDKYWDEMLNQVVGHEVCHLVAPIIYNPWQHGQDKNRGWSHLGAWKECMRVIGLKPDRCFNDNELGNLIAVRTVERNYVYGGCKCPTMTFNMTARMHNKIQSGHGRRCNRCKTSIRFLGEKMEAKA